MFFRRLKVPDSPFSIPVSATREDLNSLIAHLLQGNMRRCGAVCVCVCVCVCVVAYTDSDAGDDASGREVEFLIRGELLHTTLETHLAKKTVSSVSEIVIHHIAGPFSISAFLVLCCILVFCY